MTDTTTWIPPFCAHDPQSDMACPKCGAMAVCVREQDTYFDCDEVDAFCSECHAALRVSVNVEITYSDVEATDGDE